MAWSGALGVKMGKSPSGGRKGKRFGARKSRRGR